MGENGRWQEDDGLAGRTIPKAGRSATVCRSVAWASWGKQVLRNTASNKMAIIMLVFTSLARGPGAFERDGTSTQAERRPDCREVEPAKYGLELVLNNFHKIVLDGNVETYMFVHSL